MEEKVSRLICRLIAGIVVTDNDLDPQEEAFVDKMLARFGIPAAERDIIFPIIDSSEAVEAIRELPPEVHAESFELLVQAAAADGKIVPEERAYLKTVAEAMGIDVKRLAELVAKHL